MGLLLACLAGAVVALISTNGVFSSGASQAAAACDGGTLPEVAPLAPAGTAGLRRAAVGVFAGRRGTIYEQGAIGSANLFTDKEPRLEAHASKQAGGGYEVRRWALDAEGRTDDVVIDELHFSDPATARRALDITISTRCRSARSARPAAYPAGAWSLTWINPDSAYQQDVLFVRGAELYRVSADPPATGSDVQDAYERGRVAVETGVLACALPMAGCDPATVRAGAERVGPPALVGSDSPRWPPDAARAQAYVRAVSLRPYDVEHTRTAARLGGAGLLSSTERILLACVPGGVPAALATAGSPLFIDGSGPDRRSFESLTMLLAAQAQATRVQAGFADALAGGCARRVVEQAMRRVQTRHAGVRLYGLRLTPLATAGADSYGESLPPLASAQRISYVIALTTPQGIARIHQYEEGFVVAYKRAVVALSIATRREPLGQPSRNYLERALAGRAIARWGY